MKIIESPCIKICTIDPDGYCDGCRRSEDEIAEWSMLSDEERDYIMDELESR